MKAKLTNTGTDFDTARDRRSCVPCRKFNSPIKQIRHSIEEKFNERLKPHNHLLHLALNEAEALACQTEFPHLLFPGLAMEKAQAIETWHSRQLKLLREAAQIQAWAE